MKKNRMVFIALIACVLVGTGIFFSLSQIPSVAASTGFGVDASEMDLTYVTGGTVITINSITAIPNELIILVITGSTTIPNNPTASITEIVTTSIVCPKRKRWRFDYCNSLQHFRVLRNTSSSFSGSPFTITVTMSSSANYNVQVFGITGENTATPFDTHITAGSSQWNGHNPSPAVDPVSPSYSTNNARDIILGLGRRHRHKRRNRCNRLQCRLLHAE